MNEATQRILTGIALTNGWTINEPVLRADGATGSQFSTGFIATDGNGKRAFVKVLDLAVDLTLDPDEQLKDLQTRLALFNYECDLLEKCVVKNIRRVVRSERQSALHDCLNSSGECSLLMENANT